MIADFEDSDLGFTRNYGVIIEFGGPAWERGLGYQTDTVYEDFPCRLSGTMTVNSSLICDLFTFSS